MINYHQQLPTFNQYKVLLHLLDKIEFICGKGDRQAGALRSHRTPRHELQDVFLRKTNLTIKAK